MDKDKMNSLMATEVMGWKLNKVERGRFGLLEKYDNGHSDHRKHLMVSKWTPTTDINQALKSADKSKKINISISKTPIGWSIFGLPDVVIVVDTLEEVPLAVCTMVLEAEGIELND